LAIGCLMAALAMCAPKIASAVPAVNSAPKDSAADGVSLLRAFVKDVKSAQGRFVQTVTSPDGKRTRKSEGTFAFQRPDRFRFVYAGPADQVIVGDGKKVWLHDADLNQVTVKAMAQAVGATPAALLAGGALDKDFVLSNSTGVGAVSSSGAVSAAPMPQQATSGLKWVDARPRNKDGQFQLVRVGFRQGQLAELEILDSFGQRSRLVFTQFDPRAKLPADLFQFTPPKGVDVLEQP
jgi:outer membrane lipoprotein carrier protein